MFKALKKLNLSLQVLIALFIGIICGLALQGRPQIAVTFIKPFGSLFLNAIKMVIVPLVFSSLVVGVYQLEDIKQLGKIGGKTFIYYLCTTVFAVSGGLFFANLIKPGKGFQLPAEAVTAEIKEAPAFVDVFVNIIPSNPLKSMVEGDMLQIIFFALIVGGAILSLGKKAKALADVFESMAEVMYKITGFIMRFAPIGVFALISTVVAQQGLDVLKPLALVIVTAYLASIVHMLAVYSAAVKTFGDVSPIKFFKGAFAAWATAFTTSSSSGSLPVSMNCAEKNLGVPKHISSFVLPLGATINMDGTAIYQGVCAVFIAQVYGVELSLAQQLSIVLTTTLASIGTAGVPGAGLVMLSMVLQSAGLPIEGIALLAGIDRILDMMRTSVNVLGDISAAVIVSKPQKQAENVKQAEVAKA